jgi:hypothetical protein
LLDKGIILRQKENCDEIKCETILIEWGTKFQKSRHTHLNKSKESKKNREVFSTPAVEVEEVVLDFLAQAEPWGLALEMDLRHLVFVAQVAA